MRREEVLVSSNIAEERERERKETPLWRHPGMRKLGEIGHWPSSVPPSLESLERTGERGEGNDRFVYGHEGAKRRRRTPFMGRNYYFFISYEKKEKVGGGRGGRLLSCSRKDLSAWWLALVYGPKKKREGRKTMVEEERKRVRNQREMGLITGLETDDSSVYLL